MTLSQIEQRANRGRLANGDFDAAAVLRFEILPEFYRKVCAEADPTWMRRMFPITLTSARSYDLPDDFQQMVHVPELVYIGEDAALVVKAENATTSAPSKPTGYYIGQRADKKWKALKLSCYPVAGATLLCVYRSRVVIGDRQDDPDLDDYGFPEDYQSGLIVGLRREILLDRFDQRDSRFITAQDQFEEICLLAREQSHDQARRSFAVYSS